MSSTSFDAAGLTIFPAELNCGVRNRPRFDSFQIP
jgi:hypothetical protein